MELNDEVWCGQNLIIINYFPIKSNTYVLKKKKKKTKNRLFKSGISEFAPKIFSYGESWQHTLYSSQGVN